MNAKNTGTGSSTVPQYGTYTVLQPIFRASDDVTVTRVNSNTVPKYRR
jgi:hypothetical protein